MEQLKTLKNLQEEILNEHKWNTPILTFCGNLRQEGIKWGKEWKKTNGVGSASVLEFIKHFFNITNEDLE